MVEAIEGLVLGTSGLHRINLANKRIELIKDAVSLGIKEFDASPMYGEGLSEAALGDCLSEFGSSLLVSTKIGFPALGPCPGSYLNMLTVKFGQKISGGLMFKRSDHESRFSVDLVMKSFAGSMKRLKAASIDTLFLHEPLKCEWPAIEVLIPFLESLRSSGTIKAFGLSGDAQHCVDLQKASAGIFSKIQIEDDESLTQLSYCRENGVEPSAVFGILRNSGSVRDTVETLSDIRTKLGSTKLLFSTTKISNLKQVGSFFIE